jgi:type I restriction-modification system DNA methylase subunit
MAINLQTIKTFPQLIKYLRLELGWPVDEEQVEDLSFEYTADELEQMGLDKQSIVKIREIKQLRPLVTNQPWGIFWIDFEPKILPITVMRRILNLLVTKQRRNLAHRATWHLDDLLFISAVGEQSSDGREINFAHFHQERGDLPTLRVLGWDGADTVLKMDYVTQTLKERLCWPLDTGDVQTWRDAWATAFRHPPGHTIRTADALAERLAELARNIRAAAETLMEHETEKGRLRKLHKAFQTALIHDLTESDFADTYAQTITYGLLTAAISRTDMQAGSEGTALVAENMTDMVPQTNPFLRELLTTFLFEGGRQGGINFDELGVQDVVELLRGDETDLPAVLRDFGNKAQGEDPVIHFYEHFLNAYNKKLKVQRGVFYTPKPVVSFIVRSVHELLQKDFGLEDGLADTATWGKMEERIPGLERPATAAPDSHFVMILDPATGTGTFLVEVIDVIERTMKGKWARELRLRNPDERETWKSSTEILKRWNEYVPEHLLPRFYGYELMMAPYAIAHMKVGLKLHETGYSFGSNERVRVYLTNALDEPSPLAHRAASLFEALGHEADAVNDVKRRILFTIVIGNPPYSGQSANSSKNSDGSLNFIGKMIRDYYFVDGQPLNEKNSKWLQDDYVKFIRLGQWSIRRSQVGILAMITNHGFLENPTFRGMRQHLMRDVSKIFVLDLHGNSIKKETAVDGSKDENVFDIKQGVSISIMVRVPSENGNSLVYHENIFGLREWKNTRLLSPDFDWQKLNPKSPLYLFSLENEELRQEYDKGWRLTEAMPLNSVGLVTARDKLTIQMTSAEVLNIVTEFALLGSEEARERFDLGEDVQDWQVSLAQDDIREHEITENNIVPIVYRPFDIRFTYYTGRSRGFICRPRTTVMRHMLSLDNIGLISARSNKSSNPDHFYATSKISEAKCGESTTQSCLFPLYVSHFYKRDTNILSLSLPGFEGQKKEANFTYDFIADICSKTDLSYLHIGSGDLEKTFGPENLLSYIYGIFHSESYRNRYSEFLKTDFPRFPVTTNIDLFRKLCHLGNSLIKIHLLEPFFYDGLASDHMKYTGNKPSHHISLGYPKYKENDVFINPSESFSGVQKGVWEFTIGGYQVCHKWLKDRRGRQLSSEDIEHYQKIVRAIGKTIEIMGEIDEVIEEHGGWPIQ